MPAPSQVDLEANNRTNLEQFVIKRNTTILEAQKKQPQDLEPFRKFKAEEKQNHLEPPAQSILEKEETKNDGGGDVVEDDLKKSLINKSVIHESKENDEIDIRDTGTIHMLAVTAVTQTEHPNRSLRPWLFALMSLTFIMIQSAVFYMIIKESDILPCSAHIDCLTRKYCDYNFGEDGGQRQALCNDCKLLTTLLDYDDDYYKLTSDQACMFIFVIFILVAHMSTDIEEATIEEALLRKNGATTSNIPALILLASLRHRRMVLPWGIALAVIVITLTEDDLSMKNMLLNAAALKFLLNVDSLVLKKSSSSSSGSDDDNDNRNSSEEMIIIPVREGVDYSWWGPRVESIVIGVVVIITVLNVRSVVKGLNDIFYGDVGVDVSCLHFYYVLWWMLVYGSLSTCIIHALCHLYTTTCSTELEEEEEQQEEQVVEGEEEQVEGEEEQVKGKRKVLLIVTDTLFQSMASLSPLYLFAFLSNFIDMDYTWYLYGDELKSYGILAATSLSIYVILALLLHRYAMKKSI
jgi:hypothetical protein